MKIQIREGVFETNSSSTHSMTMCGESEYQKWVDGEVVFDPWSEEFVDYDAAIKEVLANEYVPDEDKEILRASEDEGTIAQILSNNEYDTYEAYMENYDYDAFVDNYETKDGEKVVAFGRYSFM